MVLPAFIALVLGIGLGLADYAPSWLLFITEGKDIWLYSLLLLVGLSIGNGNGMKVLNGISKRNLLLVPIGTIAGSLLGGAVATLLSDFDLNIALSISSGMGWYSLAGITLTELAGATVGSIAFLSNFFREMVSFFIIPLIAKYLDYPTAIAPAGATSEDTTLSMIIRHTDEETVALSVFNGIVLSAAVPFLLSFCFSYL